MRSLRGCLAAALVLIASPLCVFAQRAFDQAGFDQATSMILCDCGCHPQSVKECACGRAAEMRAEIRPLIAGGMSGDEVIASYVERFGEQIRISPTATGFNLVAWLGPLLALAGSSLALLFMLRRWSRRAHAERAVPVAPVAPPAADDPYRERLRRALEEMQ